MHAYQYDGFNRLIQVNKCPQAPPPGWDGKVDDHNQIGALVCRYTYDGLGRLIVKETPVQMGPTYLQRKDLYYDGVRRIQEHIYRPDLIEPEGGQLLMGGGEGGGGEPGGGEATSQPVENNESPVALEVEGEPVEPEQQLLQSPQPPGSPEYWWTDREYVWGPEYVDELICQIPPSAGEHAAPVMYAILDGNYNP